MSHAVYYNEFDPKKAAWLRELIADRQIAKGEVDERSIVDVQPGDLRGFRQCHFFAGIGLWSRAMRDAGVSDSDEVWTGSCPCPPFSVAGKKVTCPRCDNGRLVWCPRRTGYAICAACRHAWAADERHLFPEWWRLIVRCRPRRILGEQVADGDGMVWFSAVRASLEIASYALRGFDLPASCVGAPHIRQRLFFVAYADGRHAGAERQQRGGELGLQQEGGRVGELAKSAGFGHDGRRAGEAGYGPVSVEQPERLCDAGGVADAKCEPGCSEHGSESRERGNESPRYAAISPGPTNGFWRDAEWIWCRDEKWRPIERAPQCISDGLADDLGRVRLPSGAEVFFPLQKKGKARVMRLKGYGDAIVLPLATEFVKAAWSVIA